jgi:uncharacterized protein YdaU (DUF1376 family)
MKARAHSPATAVTVDREDRYAGTAGRYAPVEEKASPRPPAPWFRLHPMPLKASFGDLRAGERGILLTLMMEMHLLQEPVRRDVKRLARLCGTTPSTLEAALQTLAEKGLINVHEGSGIWSSYMETERTYRAEKSRVAKENASKLSQKAERNQSPNSTTAHKSLESREEEDRGDGFTVPAQSPSSSTTEGVGNALGSASLPGRPYTKGDRISVPGRGWCTLVDEPYANGSLLVVAENSDHMIVTLNDCSQVVTVEPFERSDDEDLSWMDEPYEGGEDV